MLMPLYLAQVLPHRVPVHIITGCPIEVLTLEGEALCMSLL